MRLGQPLGKPFMQADACMLHAPTSGTITDILPAAGDTSAIAILETDGKDTPFAPPSGCAEPTDAHGIIALAREAGIVSVADHLPLWHRLEKLRAHSTDIVVLHAVEDEPFLSSSYHLLCDRPDDVAHGLALALRCAGKADALLAIGEDVPTSVSDALCESVDRLSVKLRQTRVDCRYPAGQEAYLARRLCSDSKKRLFFLRPEDCLHLARAAAGIPQTTRIVTLGGDALSCQQNLEVRIGTPLRALLAQSGPRTEAQRIILNSPMNGRAVLDLDQPVTKLVGAVLTLSVQKPLRPCCIHCGRCVQVCPEGLLPYAFAQSMAREDPAACNKLLIHRCTLCGCCAYICPGRLPLVEIIRQAQQHLQNGTDGGT